MHRRRDLDPWRLYRLYDGARIRTRAGSAVLGRTITQGPSQMDPTVEPGRRAYVARGQARRAFKRAFDAQLAIFNSRAPAG